MGIHTSVNTRSDERSLPIGNAGVKEREIFMFQSLHSSEEAEEKVCYGFTGVVLSTTMDDVARGERIQGEFSCSTGILEVDSTDSPHEDEGGSLSLVIGPYQIQSEGPLRIQRLITPQFYRIAIRCDRFVGPSSGVGRVNLAFYSDPRFCEGADFHLNALDIGKIPMPSLYLEALSGTPILNAKLQTLDRDEASLAVAGI